MPSYASSGARIRRLLTGLLATLTLGSGARATPTAPCTAPEYRQFDFWLGRWRVTEGGAAAGTNEVRAALGGCVLTESWAGVEGGRGRSLNGYDRARGVWHQTWMDARGGLLVLEGGLRGSDMVLEGDRPDADGGGLRRHRITWSPLPGGDVRQHWQASRDGGRTWETVFDGLYHRVR